MRVLLPTASIAVAALLACDPGPTSPTVLRDARSEPSLCGLHTETQARWGAACGDPGPGCLRDELYPDLFPEGLYVGCGELTSTLLTSHAVELALPSSGKPRALYPSEAAAFDGEGDPVVGTALFGQAVALTLNIAFSTVPAFAPDGQLPLGELVVADPASPCAGMTVDQVLAEANSNLGLCDTVFTPTQIYSCTLAINKAFAGDTHACSDLLARADELR